MSKSPDPVLACPETPLPCFLVRDEEALLFLGHDPAGGLGFPTAVDGEAVRVIIPEDLPAEELSQPPGEEESWDACAARSPTDPHLYRIFRNDQHRRAFQARQSLKWICVDGPALCGMLVADRVGRFAEPAARRRY
jgi:hypothetical protein